MVPLLIPSLPGPYTLCNRSGLATCSWVTCSNGGFVVQSSRKNNPGLFSAATAARIVNTATAARIDTFGERTHSPCPLKKPFFQYSISLPWSTPFPLVAFLRISAASASASG